MRKPIIVGNWKMNNGPAKAEEFHEKLSSLINNNGNVDNVEWAIAAPALSIPMLMGCDCCEGELNIPLAAQNVHFAPSGAFTGELSLSMLEEAGVEYVIIGHSERREMFNETNETVNKKVIATLATDITPIMAYGETEAQFDANETLNVVREQLTEGLKGISATDITKVVLAYEPIWAIGTGKTATPEQAQSVIKASRDILAEMFGQEAADQVRIQYGGSMNPANIKELMAQPDIDGGLVGGASLEAESFYSLITFNK